MENNKYDENLEHNIEVLLKEYDIEHLPLYYTKEQIMELLKNIFNEEQNEED